MVAPTLKASKYFLQQHIDSSTHQRFQAARRHASVSASLEEKVKDVDCEGISLSDEQSSRGLSHYSHHFRTWLSWLSDCPEFKKHHYCLVDDGTTWLIRHGECLKRCPQAPHGRSICRLCTSIVENGSLKKRVVQCALKKYAAELLRTRLFETSQQVADLQGRMQEDVLWHRHQDRMQKLHTWRDYELQSWVRSTFLSVRVDRRNENYTSFLDTVVAPCCSLNVTSVANGKPQLMQVQQIFQKFLEDLLICCLFCIY